LLNGGALSNVTFMNYVSSHDDSHPFDKERKRTFESATKLLLSPGQAQIYYGDEIARPLIIEGAQGDVNLRSIMDWGDNSQSELLSHWQKLGKFRQAHPSVGAGKHQMISEEPYVFSRTYNKNGVQDQVVVALDLKKGKTSLNVNRIFEEGTKVRDAYSDKTYEVKKGKLKVSGDAGVVLLEEMK
jgi:alpha-amylase